MEMLNIILIHTARTWERIRLEQPYQEMPCDNIESTELIEEIAFIIYNNDPIVQEFLKTGNGDVWFKTQAGFSDTYIEDRATDLIKVRVPRMNFANN